MNSKQGSKDWPVLRIERWPNGRTRVAPPYGVLGDPRSRYATYYPESLVAPLVEALQGIAAQTSDDSASASAFAALAALDNFKAATEGEHDGQ